MNRFPLKVRWLALLPVLALASCASDGRYEFEAVEMSHPGTSATPVPDWEFEVVSYYARPSMSPPGLDPAYHSFSAIGLSSVNGAPGGVRHAIAYFHWGRDAYREPTRAGDLLHLHYPISAFAAVLELLNTRGRVKCFWYDNPGPSLPKAGIEHFGFVPR